MTTTVPKAAEEGEGKPGTYDDLRKEEEEEDEEADGYRDNGPDVVGIDENILAGSQRTVTSVGLLGRGGNFDRYDNMSAADNSRAG